MSEIVGDIGFYVPYGDEKSTAEAINKALNEPDELGKKQRKEQKRCSLWRKEKRNL